MTDYESPIYLTDVEAEELLGVIAAYAADEHGRERPHGLHGVMDQLYRQCGPEALLDLLHGKAGEGSEYDDQPMPDDMMGGGDD